MGRVVPDNLFWPKKSIFICIKIYKQYEIGQTHDNLRRRHFLLICRRVIWIITSNFWQYRCCSTSPWRRLDQIKRWKKVSSPAESFCNKLSSSVFLIQLLLTTRWNLCTHYAKFNESTYFRQLWNHSGPFWRLFSFFKDGLLLNFNKLLFTGIQQLEDISSIVCTNLCAWLDVLHLGANHVSVDYCFFVRLMEINFVGMEHVIFPPT